jgi:hypothetical protein
MGEYWPSMLAEPRQALPISISIKGRIRFLGAVPAPRTPWPEQSPVGKKQWERLLADFRLPDCYAMRFSMPSLALR